MAASSRVFSTFELLECILSYVPARDVLLAQRVNKKWRGVICGSSRLQRALFFEPDKGEPLILARDDHNARKYWIRPNTDEEVKVVRNKLLAPLFGMLESTEEDYSIAAGLPPPWRYEKASWKRMLPAQPALVTSAYVGLWTLPEFWCAWYTEKVVPLFCTRDVTIGKLFDELEEKFGCFPYCKKKIVIVGLDDRLCDDQE